MVVEKLKKLVEENTLHVTLDSRLINRGDFFVPITGEIHDGHAFVDIALEKGAQGIIEEELLYELVRYKLSLVNPKIIGITGSSGKTTTTQFTYQLLSKKYPTCLGYLNTKLGLAVNTINEMFLDCRFFVAEMGMDRPGELEETTSLFPPNIAVITTINETHMEKLGSLENIARAKFGIASNMKKEGVLVLNADCPLIKKYADKNRVAPKISWFGPSFKESKTPPNFLNLSSFTIPGEYNKSNLLAALCVLETLNLPLKDYEEYLEFLQLPKGRFNRLEGINESVIFDDTYNASPASTIEALENISSYRGSRKIAILGDMLELGPYEKEGHLKVAEKVNELGIDILVTVGNLGRIIFENAEIQKKFHLERAMDFKRLLDSTLNIKRGDIVLVKGSQGVRMEKITEMLLVDPGKAGDLLVRQDPRWN